MSLFIFNLFIVSKKNLDSISDPFEREYFKMKKIDIIKNKIRKFQANGSSDPNDDNFNNFNEYDYKNYEGDLPQY